ncbi:MAG: hypothetical protein QME81_15585 [bacterium]|nr:hypothetical protein [bacterium]
MVDLHFKILPAFEAEVRDQLKEIDKVYQRVEKRSHDFKKNPERTESLSYQLHNLYCAFEDLFRIVAEHFENSITDKERWHAELLKRMKIEVEGIRPAFISEDIYVILDKLRAFRHRFRHAYTYDLDPDEIELVLEKAIRLKGIYQTEAERFLNLIKKGGEENSRRD